MKVVLLTTAARPRSYFDAVRADLGDRADLDIDVIGWSPPQEPLGDSVRGFTLVGPGRMPADAPGGSPAAPEVDDPRVAGPERPGGPAARRVPPFVRTIAASKPGRVARRLVGDGIARRYWSGMKGRHDVQELVAGAGIVVALDNRAITAGWHLARRPGAPSVVLGAPAAARELTERDLHR